jgi:hypothetical protein
VPQRITTTIRRTIENVVVFGVVLAGFSGLLLSDTPVYADDTTIFVAVGSDTTQDVINQFSLDLGANTLGSWDATNQLTQAAHEVITPAKEGRNADGTPNPLAAPENCSFDRPNGSDEGLADLEWWLNPRPAVVVPGGANPPQQGCVDIARSAGGPAASGQQSPAGQLLYIPFALDTVTGATGSSAGMIMIPGTCTVSTPASNVQGADFTLIQLQALYAHGTPETASNGVTYNPAGGPTALQPGQVAIDLYVPQPGSATRDFWASTLGFSTTTLPAWVFDHIQSDNNDTVSQFVGDQVQENDGTAVTVDPNGYMPFSVAQYIGQGNGHNPRLHQAVLATVNSVAPVVSGALNTSFPITREVYNVVLADRVVNTGDGHFDSQLAKLLAGGSSVLCRDSATVTAYGFALLSSSTTDTCGSTAASLRAFPTI